MEAQRRKSIVILSGILALLLFFPLYEFTLSRRPTPWELVGLSVGVLIGILLSFYINTLWDPVQLRPLRQDHPNAGWIRHARPLAAFIAGTISPIAILIFGAQGARIVALGAGGISATLLFAFILRLWVHRPRP